MPLALLLAPAVRAAPVRVGAATVEVRSPAMARLAPALLSLASDEGFLAALGDDGVRGLLRHAADPRSLGAGSLDRLDFLPEGLAAQGLTLPAGTPEPAGLAALAESFSEAVARGARGALTRELAQADAAEGPEADELLARLRLKRDFLYSRLVEADRGNLDEAIERLAARRAESRARELVASLGGTAQAEPPRPGLAYVDRVGRVVELRGAAERLFSRLEPLDPPGRALLERAWDVAVLAHAGDRRKFGGAPYLRHVLGAAAFLVDGFGVRDAASAAVMLLHDVKEDHPDLWARVSGDFPPEVVRGVERLTKSGSFAAYLGELGRDGTRLDVLRKLSDRVNNLRGIRQGLIDTAGTPESAAALAFARKQFAETELELLPFIERSPLLTEADRRAFRSALSAEVERILRLGLDASFLDGLRAELDRRLLADLGELMPAIGPLQALIRGELAAALGVGHRTADHLWMLHKDGDMSPAELLELARRLAAVDAGPEETRAALAEGLRDADFPGRIAREGALNPDAWGDMKFFALQGLPRRVWIRRNDRFLSWRRDWLADSASAEVSFSEARVELVEGDVHVAFGVLDGLPLRCVIDKRSIQNGLADGTDLLAPLLASPRLSAADVAGLLRVARRLKSLGISLSGLPHLGVD